MARDYFSTGYLHLTELQPYHPYDIHQASSSAAPYEVTGGAGAAGAGAALPPTHHHPHHDPRKRRVSHVVEEPGAGCEGAPVAPPAPPAPSRRRKTSSSYNSVAHSGTSSVYEEESEDARSTRSLPDKKQNHSEIEKRRRDKMNTYISELAGMVPACGAMARKLDKLTVLRLAVQHLRAVRGALSAGQLTTVPRPAYVTERELNHLLVAAGRDACLLVVGCDRGRLLYVSNSVTPLLHYDKSELLGQSLFDILHPKDVAKVKEQLSSSDLNPRERLIDAKTMLPVKSEAGVGCTRLCPGARRSFFCRIKCKASPTPPAPPAPPAPTPDLEPKLRKKNHEKKYCVVQCTGYLKSWAPAEMWCEGAGSGGEEDAASVSCLVTVGRALHHLPPPPAPAPAPAPGPKPPARRLHFLSRHANDGKYLFVDQRVTLALGFLPQELLGTSLYEYVSARELAAVARAHRAALQRREPHTTPPYGARRKDGTTALLQTHFKPFRNPWTKDVECLVAHNTLVSDALPPTDLYAAAPQPEEGGGGGGEVECAGECDAEVQRLIDSQVESHKIGSAIAEEALRRSPASCALDLPPELLADALFAGTGGEAAPDAPPSPASMTLDGNGEAAMAVIMSLLEADAGLGGPVNFSGLPWPLP